MFSLERVRWSSQLREKLRDHETAGKFRIDITNNYLNPAFRSVQSQIPHPYGKLIKQPDPQLTYVAIDSAFLDLEQADAFHELQNGPSLIKVAAAVTCWLNRFKPLQFNGSFDHELVVFINPLFALEVGMAILASASDEPVASFEEKTRRFTNTLIYVLTWRNPGFRELATLFEFLVASPVDGTAPLTN